MMSYIVAALYHFSSFADHSALRQPLLDLCRAQGVKGTLLLAAEGVNGTIAGQENAIALVVDHIRALPGCAGLDVKYSRARMMPFQRMKVRLKKEIVTMKVEGLDPARHAGHYVEPQDWNALVDDPDTILIDTRNDFEVGYGSFAGAINPETGSFGEFPGWWQENAAEFSGKRIAMFCTGGIRCEKSTAYLRSQGIEDVYHLKGGILNYLEKIPQDDSRWHGGCFVFDERVSLGHGLIELGDKKGEEEAEALTSPICSDEAGEAESAT
ncbi:MAG TPA: rhodanese-related sulfurtransferase [Sphingopyxis sp.]|nr:rhodanese-related sulfurtransferase [Sphingopyxis sp.]